jgi:hypothetical protein
VRVRVQISIGESNHILISYHLAKFQALDRD